MYKSIEVSYDGYDAFDFGIGYGFYRLSQRVYNLGYKRAQRLQRERRESNFKWSFYFRNRKALVRRGDFPESFNWHDYKDADRSVHGSGFAPSGVKPKKDTMLISKQCEDRGYYVPRIRSAAKSRLLNRYYDPC